VSIVKTIVSERPARTWTRAGRGFVPNGRWSVRTE